MSERTNRVNEYANNKAKKIGQKEGAPRRVLSVLEQVQEIGRRHTVKALRTQSAEEYARQAVKQEAEGVKNSWGFALEVMRDLRLLFAREQGATTVAKVQQATASAPAVEDYSHYIEERGLPPPNAPDLEQVAWKKKVPEGFRRLADGNLERVGPPQAAKKPAAAPPAPAPKPQTPIKDVQEVEPAPPKAPRSPQFLRNAALLAGVTDTRDPEVLARAVISLFRTLAHEVALGLWTEACGVSKNECRKVAVGVLLDTVETFHGVTDNSRQQFEQDLRADVAVAVKARMKKGTAKFVIDDDSLGNVASEAS